MTTVTTKVRQNRSIRNSILVLFAGLMNVGIGAYYVYNPEPLTETYDWSEATITRLGYFNIGLGASLIIASILILAASYRIGGTLALMGGIISIFSSNPIPAILAVLGGWWTLKQTRQAVQLKCPACSSPNPIGARICYTCGTPLVSPTQVPLTVPKKVPTTISIPPTRTEIMCPNCGQMSPPNSLFCGFCGTKFEKTFPTTVPYFEPTRKCPTCSTENPISSKFCHNCGKKLEEPSQKTGAKTPSIEPPEGQACPFCGGRSPANAKFCGNCGAKL